jgi:signal transduction histidine kinase
MRINGVSWTPCVAGAAAAALYGVGIDAWTAAPLGAATALVFACMRLRSAGRRAAATARAELCALQRVLARRNEHLARTVHELRMPLGAVIAALDRLRADHASGRQPPGEVLAGAALAANHLDHLVDDVLDDAAIAAGRLHLALGSHRVQTLLADCHPLLRLHAERRGVRFEVAGVTAGLAVRTDPRRFAQIVGNLVGSTLQATPAGGSVQLCVLPDRRCVRFVVVDRGGDVGATAAGASTTAHAAGTGLGWQVSMRLVQQMGGRIDHGAAEHAPTWFELPRAVPRPAPHKLVAPMAGTAR